MKTTPETFKFDCDTITLVRLFRRFSERPYVSAALERVLAAIESELAIRAAVALANI